MGIFNTAVYNVMTWINGNITHNFVVTIILATIVLKLIMLPADMKQRKESRKMSALQPELMKLQKRYANDPTKLQQKQSELYKKHNVKVYASCLPMLITWPIFIIFFGGLRLLANEMSVQIALEVASGNVAYLDQFNFLWINNIFQPDSGMASVVMSLSDFTNLMKPDSISALTMLSEETIQAATALVPNYEALVLQPANAHILARAPQFLQNMVGEGGALSNGWFILPALAGLSAFFQNRVTMKSQPAGTQTTGMGKGMTLFIVALSVVFCVTSNSLFAIYWLTSNVFSLVMQIVLNKVYPPTSPDDEGGRVIGSAGGNSAGNVIEGKGTVK